MRNYVIAAVVALCITTVFAGQFASKSQLGVQVGEIGENKQYPAEIQEYAIGEYEFLDGKQANNAITGISLKGKT